MTPVLATDLQGLSLTADPVTMNSGPAWEPTKHELLHRVTGEGLSAIYRSGLKWRLIPTVAQAHNGSGQGLTQF